MKCGMILIALVSWGLGVVCGVFSANLAGYQYYIPETGSGSTFVRMVHEESWEPVSVGDSVILRRPRIQGLW